MSWLQLTPYRRAWTNLFFNDIVAAETTNRKELMHFEDLPQNSPLQNKQDAVMQDYLSFLKKKGLQWSDVHSFFSPLRVPVGLTDEELLIIVALYPLRRAQVYRAIRGKLPPQDKKIVSDDSGDEIYKDSVQLLFEQFEKMGDIIKAYSTDVPLPEELGPSETMTRERFQTGIMKFLAQIHA
jgi:hypothetical protein